MATIYLSLGSNIEPESNLRTAVESLRQLFSEIILSPVYQSPAVGMVGDDFLNAAARAHTGLTAEEVVVQLRSIEDQLGRDRSAPRFSSRTLDLDLLLYDDLVLSTPELAVPRDEITEHAFVLQPLVDIAPDLLHPLSAQPLAMLLKDLQQRQPEQFEALQKISLPFPEL